MKNKKSYPVIHLQSTEKSFAWNDGLFIVVKKSIDTIALCKIGNNGQPQLDEKGKFEITCTSTGNKGITKTNLIYKP